MRAPTPLIAESQGHMTEENPARPQSRVLVVGGSSYIGQFIIDHLLQCGDGGTFEVAGTFATNAKAMPQSIVSRMIAFESLSSLAELQNFVSTAFDGKLDAVSLTMRVMAALSFNVTILTRHCAREGNQLCWANVVKGV